jgi:phosphatidylglycerophosphatase A
MALTTSKFRPDFKFVMSHPAHLFSFGFGSGLSRFAPGTAGSLAAIPLYIVLAALLPKMAILALIGVSFVFGVWCCEVTGKAVGVADYGGIVWDEIVAMWLILLYIPQDPLWFAAAFFVFRVFDVWKPFPIRYVDDHTHGGFGVMFDDLLAAGYSLLALKAVEYWAW